MQRTHRFVAIALAVLATVTQLSTIDVLAYTQHAGATPLFAAKTVQAARA